MSEFKMSDVFNLPLMRFNNMIHDSEFKTDIRGQFGTTLSDLDHAIYAINNHDRLVEENQRLTEIATKHATRADELCEALETVLLVLEGKTEFNPDEISTEGVREVLNKSQVDAISNSNDD